MHIEDIESFTAWLTKELTPICDADPIALAKYILALIRKPEKTEEEVRANSLEQLEVFLKGSTKRFVESMFTVLGNNSYVPKKEKSEIDKKKEKAASAVDQQPSSSSNLPAKEKERERGERGSDRTATEKKRSSRDRDEAKLPRETKGGSGDRERGEDRPSGRRGAPPPPSSTSSSAPAPASTAPSMGGSSSSSGGSRREEAPPTSSREIKEERGSGGERGGERPLRKRISPPPADAKPKRERETRERENREPARRRSRSPRERRTRGRRSPEGRRHIKRSRSRSQERERRSDRKDEDRRKKRERCRDYDEQGFCMRGDLCQFDHGPDPVVVDHESAIEKMVKANGGSATAGANFSIPPPGYNPLNPPPPGVDGGAFNNGGSVPAVAVEGYNPEAPSLNGPNFTVPPPPLPMHMNNAPWRPTPYSLPQPVNGASVSQAYDPTSSVPVDPSSASHQQQGAGGHMRGGGAIGRGGGGRGGARFGGGPPVNRGDGKTIQVKKIPQEQNNIAKLNEHFGTFGNIVNMQVQFNGDPECALITYSSRTEAVSAIKSPTPVLNNRFIRVFWFNPDQPDGSIPKAGTIYAPTGSHQRSILNSGLAVDVPVATPPVVNELPPPVKVASVRQAKFVSQAVREERERYAAVKAKLADAKGRRDEMLRKQISHNALMDRLMAQQKNVLGVLRDPKCSGAHKKKMVGMAKETGEEIVNCKEMVSKLIADLQSTVAEIGELEKQIVRSRETTGERNSESPPLKEEVEAEDDDQAGETEGKVAVVTTQNLLKRSAVKYEDDDDELDVKPKLAKKSSAAVTVTGFNLTDEQDVIAGMEQWGELVDVELLPGGGASSAAASFTYKEREGAEKAVNCGVEVNGVTLSVAWMKDDVTRSSQKDSQMSANQLLSSIGNNDSDDE